MRGVFIRALNFEAPGLSNEGSMKPLTDAYDPNINYQYFAGVSGGSDSEKKLAAIRLPDLTGKRFLDLGCNAGFFCGHAKEAGAGRVLGVDNSAKVIALARQRHPDLEFWDTGWDPFPEGEFDVVICLSAIHYASNPIQLVTGVYDHLSEEGLFILEGGFVNDEMLRWTDVPAVTWREVGDRVRHMSAGLLRRHMLTGFDWEVVGPSDMQGGDPIPRFVIHARKKPGLAPSSGPLGYRLCPVEYARVLALSAPTIQDNQPSHSYVRALGMSRGIVSPKHVEQVLGDERALACFVDDVAFALSRHGSGLQLRPSIGEALTSRLAAQLQQRGIETSIHAGSPTDLSGSGPADESDTRSALRRMEAGVELSDEGEPADRLVKILELCDLADAKVADLSREGSGLWRHLLKAGARECHVVVSRSMPSLDRRVTVQVGEPWELRQQELDFVFFDATLAAGFDHVDGTARLAESLARCLAPEGLAYLVLRTGIVQTDWDVFNSILLTPIGRLPTSEYLYEVLLRDFAVRPLVRLTDDASKAFSVTRIFRVAPCQPTLLIVVGRSQSGKTTLARKLRRVPDAVHFSSDYLFYELFRFKAAGALPGCSPQLLEVVGGGSAEEVGNFFRTVEKDAGLFEDYMKLILKMIPNGRRMISLDLDLRRADRLDELKRYFTDAGFSVWIASR